MNKKNIRWTLFALLLLLVVLSAMHIVRYLTRNPRMTQPHKTIPVARISEMHNQGAPQVGGAFTLRDLSGKAITEKSFPGKYLLLYFGYTFCPDICPAALVNISDALKALGNEALQLEVLFITLDPERDTPEAMERYLSNFHKKIRPLWGSAAEIQAAAKTFRVFFRKVKPENATDYVIDHSSIIYMMNPQGKLVRHFNHETPVQTLVYEIGQALHE